MKQELYLNLKTSWQSIWEVIRAWILNNKGTGFKSLPQRRPSEGQTWVAPHERLKAIPSEREFTVSYVKIRDGITWNTELFFRRATRSIYTKITVEPMGADASVEIKTPRIVTTLQKRFGNMNVAPPKRDRNMHGRRSEGCGNALTPQYDEHGRLKVVIDGATPAGAKVLREVVKNEADSKKPKRVRKSGVRAKNGELTQDDVAKDFRVRRQTVVKWEDKQTVDGPDNTSNPYHYYRALRLDPNLRGAYTELVRSVGPYLDAKADAKSRGIRFRVTFERFNEKFKKHNQKS